LFEISKGQIINVDPQVWDHMKHATVDVDNASLSVDRKRVFRETSSGMDMARRSCTQTCELRRHETYKHLLALQECFGESITASQTKRTKTAPLDENDIINCIEGSTVPEMPFVRKSTKTGLDFEFDPELGELKVEIQYGKYVNGLDNQGRLVNKCSPLLSNFILRGNPYDIIVNNDGTINLPERGDGNNMNQQIACGDKFEHDGKLYCVEQVTDGKV
jgi:hypothetical protein